MSTKEYKEYKRKYQKKYRLNNPEKILESQRKWKARNLEKLLECKKKWRLNNPEKTKQIQKRYKIKYYFDSVERYNEAMLKYDGECAFACDRKAELVHHLDGIAYHNSSGENVDNSLKNLLPLCKSCHATLHEKGVKHDNQRKN